MRMRFGKWEVFTEFGWYAGNPSVGFVFRFGDVVEDYPEGCAAITIFGIQIAKFCMSFGIFKN